MLSTLLVALAAAQPEAGADPCGQIERCLALDLHTVGAIDDAFIETQLATMNQHFAAIEVRFVIGKREALEGVDPHVATRSDRDRIGRKRIDRGMIPVFLVERLDNVDEEGQIRGVHWRDRNNRKRRWVIVSKIAPAYVLAHEMGHYFGLPHSDYPISIMNKSWREEPPAEQRTFAEPELKKMKGRVKAALRRGQLKDARKLKARRSRGSSRGR